ncbi:MAG: DUF4416 family protein [Synergistaceae bacterium]|nr:DUF4416 family protein [Synergistaceae bacterium]
MTADKELSSLLHDCEARHPRDPLVKKVLAILVPRNDRPMFDMAKELLREAWGEPERVSPLIPFTWTNYYVDIAPELDRCFFSYPGLYPMSKLPEWKILTCDLEKKTGDTRRVNLDPGTLDGARLLLASTKGQAHRIYIKDGIFEEVTLCRRNGKWQSFFYTFPDFKSGVYDAWLETVREDWKREHFKIFGSIK